MISENETQTYADIEQAMVKRLTENLNLIARQRRQQVKIQNANEILKLNKIMSSKFYDNKTASRLTYEYLNFLIRFYKNKNKNTARKMVLRFLDAINKDFKSLDVSSVYRNYRKLIHSRIDDYNINDEESDNAHFEDCATNSHILYSGNKVFHYII